VLDRRFANLHVVLAPVRVQGAGAAEEIAAAIDLLNARGGLDVLIVGRGGGSLEDLWCFNEEAVVRAIVRSNIPVISAVGHEIDWTLSDFAADVRAPTPSAAAEMVVKGKDELERRVSDLRRRMGLGARAAVAGWRHRLDRAARTPGLLDPLQVAERLQQRVDFLAVRLQNALAGLPQLVRQRTETAARRMELAVRMRLDENRRALKHAEAQLRMLNPKGVLARGYSLTRLRGGKILRSAAEAPPGTRLETEFADGAVPSTVDSAGGGRHGDGKDGETPELRKGAGAAGGDRGGDGKRRPRPGKDGGGLRRGPEAGQAVLF
jgi:exodeoxyribonuclease VII large subunit